MCGIFGIIRYDGKPVDVELLRRSTNALRHRGPDDEGYLLANSATGRVTPCGGVDTDKRLRLPSISPVEKTDVNLAFGFRRLSILDLSTAGHQPMASADASCWIVFNGEIYNYLELRSELKGFGHTFKSGTDTEVLLAAYQQWGSRCVERFVGMWAFAIWDKRAQTIFLSRDPFGIKPLYYTCKDNFFAFASEIKALLHLNEISRRINPGCLYFYLNSGLTDHEQDTFFLDVKQIAPAHFLTVKTQIPNELDSRRYWRINLDQKTTISLPEAANHLREIFLANVGLHLRSDVPVGSALSGGIDSSSIVCSMRYLEGANIDVHTFSFLADDPAIDEERWVDIVGTASDAKLHKVRIQQEELVADLDRLIYSHDIPFGSTSIYAQHRVFRLAHEAGIKVMMDGQGADEYLAGYVIYRPSRLASLIRHKSYWQAIKFWRAISNAPEGFGLQYLTEAFLKTTKAKRDGWIWSLARKVYSINPRNPGRLLGLSPGKYPALPTTVNERWFETQGITPTYAAVNQGDDLLRAHLLQTITETSLPALLRVEDRNSMAFSIESRVPFLTSEIVSFVLSLPEEYIISPDATSKNVFRIAMRGIVPDAILDRKDKIGFQTPEKIWFTTLRPWVESVLQSDAASQIPALNQAGMQEHLRLVLAGKLRFDWQIWRWLNLIRWTEQFNVRYD